MVIGLERKTKKPRKFPYAALCETKCELLRILRSEGLAGLIQILGASRAHASIFASCDRKKTGRGSLTAQEGIDLLALTSDKALDSLTDLGLRTGSHLHLSDNAVGERTEVQAGLRELLVHRNNSRADALRGNLVRDDVAAGLCLKLAHRGLQIRRTVRVSHQGPAPVDPSTLVLVRRSILFVAHD